MRVFLIVFVLGCSQAVPKIPVNKSLCDSPAVGEPMTKQQCECRGARVNASPGGGAEHCGDGETELGTVKLGIEGGWCCAKLDTKPTPDE